MTAISKKRRAELDLCDVESDSQSSNGTISIHQDLRTSRKKARKKTSQGDKRSDTQFSGRLRTESLPKREHPLRKRRKTEKATEPEPSNYELSEASFTLLTDNEDYNLTVENEIKEAVTEEAEFSDISDTTERADDETSSQATQTPFSSSFSVDNLRHLTPTTDANEEEVSDQTVVARTLPMSNCVIQANFCTAVEEYTLPVYIYRCLKRPNRIVFDLSQWEARHRICTLVSDEDETDIHIVPEDATYLIFGDYMIGELCGSATFFAAKVNENRNDEKYILKVGFYYEYRDCLKAWVDEICSSNCPVPLVELAEIVSPIHGPKFRALYADMKWAVNLEYWSRSQRPQLKKYIQIANSAGSRRRSRVITPVDLVFDEKENTEYETDSNVTILAPSDS